MKAGLDWIRFVCANHSCAQEITWGHNIEATAARLMHKSIKAAENGEAYALKTAEDADYAARIRNARPPGQAPEVRPISRITTTPQLRYFWSLSSKVSTCQNC
jgi:hypothetical protein